MPFAGPVSSGQAFFPPYLIIVNEVRLLIQQFQIKSEQGVISERFH